jgi:hypothetical protein
VCVWCLGLGIWWKRHFVSVHTMNAYRGSGGLAALILDQQQMEVSGHPHVLVTLLLGERGPCIHQMGGWLGPRTGLDILERSKIFFMCWYSNPRSSSPEPSHYTNYITPAPMGVWWTVFSENRLICVSNNKVKIEFTDSGSLKLNLRVGKTWNGDSTTVRPTVSYCRMPSVTFHFS